MEPHSAIDDDLVLRLDPQVSPSHPVLCTEHAHGQRPSHKWDMHYAFELGIVLSGKIHRVYRDWDILVGPGEVWLCGMWEPHGYQVPASGCDVIFCAIWPPFLAETRLGQAPHPNWLAPFTSPPEHRPLVPPGRRRRFLQLGRRFRDLLSEPAAVQAQWLPLLLLEALLELTRDWAPRRVSRTLSQDKVARVNRAIEMVFERPLHLTAAEVARACGMSRNRFGALFRNVTGISFPHFALRHRLSGAAERLVNSEEPIKAIAHDWGFADESHLHRLFLQHYGLSPYQYRKQRQDPAKRTPERPRRRQEAKH